MAMDPRVCSSISPLLFHPDLHMRNIFVSEDDPSVITSIIDWQGTSVEPALWYSYEAPDFATGSELCIKAFELSSHFLTPIFSGPRLMDEGLFRLFHYSYRMWKDGTVVLRHELIETARHWEELGFESPCPFALPTQEQLVDHVKEYKPFEAAQALRTDLCALLNAASDGWVPPDSWEETQSTRKELFDGILELVVSNPNVDDDEPVKDKMK